MRTKVVVVGNGSMGKNHSRVVSTSDNHDLVGVFDSDPKSVSGINESLLIREFEVIASRNPDYAVIAVPTSNHFSVTSRLLKMGINVLVEKPLASTSEHCLQMISLLESTQLVGAVGHIERFNSATIHAQKLIAEGVIGEVISIVTTRQSPMPHRISDAGVILDLLSHDIDLVQWLGNSHYKRFEVVGRSGDNLGRESLVHVVGCLESGILVSHHANWIAPYKERRIQILGSSGVLEINTLTSQLRHFKSPQESIKDSSIARLLGVVVGEVVEIAFEKKEALVQQHDEMRKATLRLPNNTVNFREGFSVVSIAEELISKLFETESK